MAFDEKTTGHSTASGNQPNDGEVIVAPPHSISQPPLTVIPGGGLTKADRIRGVTKSLVMDALATLDKMQEHCQQSSDLRENYYQLYHCLDYLKRFCDGRA